MQVSGFIERCGLRGEGGAWGDREEREAWRGVSGERRCVAVPLMCPQSCEGL